MNNEGHQEQGRAPAAPVRSRGVAEFIAYHLASLRFALFIVLLIALACIAGTLIPQGEQVGQYLNRHPAGLGWIKVMDALGFTHVFYSWWFLALLMLLAASLVFCTRRRFQSMRVTTGATRIRISGSFISHVSLLLIFAGGVVRAVWSEKGVIGFREGEVVTQSNGDAVPVTLPFSVRLAKFELEYYKADAKDAKSQTDLLMIRWPEHQLQAAIPAEPNSSETLVPVNAGGADKSGLSVRVEQYVPDFVIDTSSGEAKSRSEQPNNPAVQVSIAGGGVTNQVWVFARFPEMTTPVNGAGGLPMPLQFRLVMSPGKMGDVETGPIKAYKSTLEILENGAVALTKTIAVNSPLTYHGYTFYQLSYNPEDLRWTSIQVVKDPSVPIVYTGFLLMMIGLTIVFCVGPYLDDQRKKNGGAA